MTTILATFTQTDAGIRADVFARDGALPYGVRVWDTDADETVSIKFFPTYEAAEIAAASIDAA
jgi:hypothetical protein